MWEHNPKLLVRLHHMGDKTYRRIRTANGMCYRIAYLASLSSRLAFGPESRNGRSLTGS